jgi:hypothetical protein
MKEIIVNNITLEEIKAAFKTKLGFKFDYYNDLNTAKTLRKIKISGVFNLDYVYTGPDGGVNNHLQNEEKRERIISFLKNELRIEGIEINRSGLGSFPKLVFRINN